MNDNALHNRIAEASKTLFSYCMARTPNRWEAEDLCQDILCELVKSSARLAGRAGVLRVYVVAGRQRV